MIIPALDIIQNKIVRLYQGDYNLIKYYDYNIHDMLEQYQLLGVKTVHLVDLDGARNPRLKQKSFFRDIINYFPDYIQVAGGIRDERDIDYFLSLGVKRVVIGSSVIQNIETVKKWIKYYGNEYIVVALDIQIDKNNIKKVFIHGWKQDTGKKIEDILQELLSVQIKYVLCTDISRDGTLSGPNFRLYQEMIHQFQNINFQASGGVSSIDDLSKLKTIGIHDVIIGKGLLENKFTILEAMQCWQNELFHVLT
ncbi:1-(5-phosphoribosyl)-5-[(5-phosphoribosylamino)methylideneamino]imidazole-4-carboxamide isomerase [Buchnera aphidicola]|uniref:1-(5-phosphoribosyl)-5-[(5- phosphoribosylamino)methylideneamino]imidazole-4- carboxamide isomerase n=1 Tax=Buchnera aphidicola TaxID=9 RepID=UPI003464096E